jgi:SAM-dependent methyltransferase
VAGYAYPHTGTDERHRLELLEQRVDPLTVRRIERLGLKLGSRCLEVGAGGGTIASWLCDLVGPAGRVTATDLETDFLSQLDLPNLEVRQHDVTTDDFPEGSFDLIHARAVIMHLAPRMATLSRMASWLAPGGWLLLEEGDFGLWQGDYDPLWAAGPQTWHEAFPNGSLSQGRAMLRQIHGLGLEQIGADAEVDIVQQGTPFAEFYRLSLAASADARVAAGVARPEDIERLLARMDEPDFLACGFVFMGAWGRRPPLR